MIAKPLEAITESDLEDLVKTGERESRTLEFELQPIEKSSDEKKEKENRAEFLKDVTAFANTLGGDIIYGMAEDKGVATKVLGFDISNIDAEIRRLTQLLSSQSEPPLSDVRFWPISLSNGKQALVLRVPRSWIGPHRVKINHKFFSRNSSGASEMDVWELRTAFLSSNIEKEIKDFRAERMKAIETCGATNPYPVPLNLGVREVLHLIPWSAFADSRILDIYAQNIQSQVAGIGIGGQRLTPNIDGLISYAEYLGRQGYTQLFRNGIAEAVRVYSETIELQGPNKHPCPYIPSLSHEKKIMESLGQYLSLMKLLDLSSPIVIALSFTNAKDALFYLSPEWGGARGPLPVDRLMIPEVRMNALDQEPSTVLRPVFDMVWNAFGAERSPYYDNEGRRLER
jgi:hypothetical protein